MAATASAPTDQAETVRIVGATDLRTGCSTSRKLISASTNVTVSCTTISGVRAMSKPIAGPTKRITGQCQR